METFIFWEFCKSLFYKNLNVAKFALLAFLECVGEPANLGSVSQTMYVIKWRAANSFLPCRWQLQVLILIASSLLRQTS